MRMYRADVTRGNGEAPARAAARMTAEVRRMRNEGKCWREIGAAVGCHPDTAARILQRSASLVLPWVREARALHGRGCSWTEIATTLDVDRDDAKCFVSRLVGHERGMQEITNELDRETMPAQSSQAAQATTAQ